KSTLLNVIAGRSATSPEVEVSGNFAINGISVDPVEYRKNIAYVMQDDALMATITPREALQFSAALRLEKTTIEDINELVEQTLSALGILDCADTFIGNALIKGISGGQRKRTSVGVELITSPSLILLDEPTSGLDSYTAFHLVKLLGKIAKSNATVLCTIHQPSSEVFHMFDSAIFLMQGHVLYQGPVRDIVPMLDKCGFKCPDDYNQADFLMYLTQTETMETLKKEGLLRDAPAAVGHSSAPSAARTTAATPAEGVETVVKASFSRQIAWITRREFLNTTRNVPALMGRFGVTIFLSLLFGIIFWNSGGQDDSNKENFNTHVGLMTMTMINAMFGSAQPTLLEFPTERPIFIREYSTGTYSVVPYTLSKLVMEIPMLYLQCLVQMIVLMWMTDLQGNFFALVGCTFGVGLAVSSVAVLLGCVVVNPKQAVEMAPLTMVPQILFAGFFIRTSQIPVWLRWAQYLCSLKYGINLFVINEFASYRHSCDRSPEAQMNCFHYKDANNVEPSLWWMYALILFGLFAGFRILAMYLLAKKAVRFY
ncbi:ABCG7, partial [Symbiodinium microadriaticum]